MEKIKRYIECYIDTETCNFKCHYCYIALTNRFNKKITKFKHSKEEIRQALSKERLGGTCLINLCAGGETLLSDEVVPLIRELLEEGHYVTVVTNASISKRFEEISKFPSELLDRLFFKFSFHYLELKRLKILDRFVSNIKMMENVGVSYTVEITPNDELIPYIDEVINFSKKHFGVLPHVTIARDDRKKNIEVLSKYSFEEYKKIWEVFESNLFDFKKEIFYKKRKEFCYAGDWSIYVNLNSGDIRQCYCGKYIDNIYANISAPIKFEAIGSNCPLPHCYNGHSFISLGVIPELDAPTYASLRNRVLSNGHEWLKPQMKAFMSQKLYDNNEEYSRERKNKINRTYRVSITKQKTINFIKKVVKNIEK